MADIDPDDQPGSNGRLHRLPHHPCRWCRLIRQTYARGFRCLNRQSRLDRQAIHLVTGPIASRLSRFSLHIPIAKPLSPSI
jgi:hypothetical protein